MLQPVLSEEDLYAPDGLFEFGSNEVYVDAGTFDGDTIRSFIERVHGRFDAIYGFEPDPVTFAKLKANFSYEPRLHPIHAGLHSKAESAFPGRREPRGHLCGRRRNRNAGHHD